MLQVEKQLDFRAEREGRDKKERDDKKRAFKNLVRFEEKNRCAANFEMNVHTRRSKENKRRRSEMRQPS